MAAAAEVAHGGDVHLVLTARAENYLHGRPDLADTITRLQAYQAAGADVLYAPGLTELDDIRRVVSSLDRPVNVLALPGVPPVAGAGRRPVSGGSRWARPSRGRPSGPSSRPASELLDARHLRLLGAGRARGHDRPDLRSGPWLIWPLVRRHRAMTPRMSRRWCIRPR